METTQQALSRSGKLSRTSWKGLPSEKYFGWGGGGFSGGGVKFLLCLTSDFGVSSKYINLQLLIFAKFQIQFKL